MKRIFFALMAVGMLATASSCKKCGYCRYQSGSNSSSTCKDNSFGGLLDEYEEAESQCAADNGTWVVTK